MAAVVVGLFLAIFFELEESLPAAIDCCPACCVTDCVLLSDEILLLEEFLGFVPAPATVLFLAVVDFLATVNESQSQSRRYPFDRGGVLSLSLQI